MEDTIKSSSDSISDRQCCLIDNNKSCWRVASLFSFSGYIQKLTEKKRLRLYPSSSMDHNHICEHHKNLVESIRISPRRHKHSEDSSETNEENAGEVDLSQLKMRTLRRYRNHYKLKIPNGFTKTQWVSALMEHFRTLPVVEENVLNLFFKTVEVDRNRSDQRIDRGNT